MIAAISLMKRREDISIAQFRRHWLDPHGVMTAELPSLRRYIQSHCVEFPVTNALARKIGIDGVPMLWFDSAEDRRVAYTSPRIAECNIDSEQFVGAVTRLATEPLVVIKPPAIEKPIKVLLVAVGAPDVGWAERAQAHITGVAGVVGYVRHRLIEQAAAPSSKIPEFKIAVAGVAEVTFESEAAMERNSAALEGNATDAERTAVYRVEDYNLV